MSYAAVLAVEDLSGTKMRVRLPVSAAKDVEREGAGAYPAGLWIGQVRMTQVSDVEGNLKNTRNDAVFYSIYKSSLEAMGYSSDEVNLLHEEPHHW